MYLLMKTKLKHPIETISKVMLGAGGLLMMTACSALSDGFSAKSQLIIENSPNYKDGVFLNPIPVQESGFAKMLIEWIKGGENTAPDQPIVVENRSKEDFLKLPESGLRITWLGHATSLIEIDQTRLLIDPIWSERCSPFTWMGPKRFFQPPLAIEDLPEIDAVLISHDHFDHLDQVTLEKLSEKVMKFIVPLGVGSRLIKWGISEDKITELDWWQQIKVGKVNITATPARHFSGRSLLMTDRDATLWAGFAINGEKHNVYYTGDTGMFPGFKDIGEKLGPFDVTLIEVGAYNKLWADVHLGPEQAIQAVKMARGGLMIPVHWATFDLAMHSWTEPVERLLIAQQISKFPLSIPKPGQSIELKNPALLTKWWPKLPWQTVTEHQIVSSGLTD